MDSNKTTGPPNCRCGDAWVVQKIKLDDGRIVRNYWCRLCDGTPMADRDA